MDSVEEKSQAFAVRIIKMADYLRVVKREFVISNQVLRSGTSIAANIAEAECAHSKKDFLAKMYIAFKECGETKLWLNMLHKSGKLNDKEFTSIYNDWCEINKMLSSITKTTRENLEKEKEEKFKGKGGDWEEEK